MEILLTSASGISFLHEQLVYPFSACRRRGYVTASKSTRFTHKAWFGIYPRCTVEFLCRWLKTPKEAKHEIGYFQQGDRHMPCTLDKVEYADSQCRELWPLDLEKYGH